MIFSSFLKKYIIGMKPPPSPAAKMFHMKNERKRKQFHIRA